MKTKTPSIVEMVEIVEDIGFLTGSRSLGINTHDNSDWDYVILWPKLNEILQENGYSIEFFNPNVKLNNPEYLVTDVGNYNEKDNLFRSYRMYLDGYYYNIIMVWTAIELKVWENVSKLIKTLPLNMVKNKENRIKIFECFKDIQRDILKSKFKGGQK